MDGDPATLESPLTEVIPTPEHASDDPSHFAPTSRANSQAGPPEKLIAFVHLVFADFL